MRINFFEECIGDPEIDLQNAALITWPSTVYIAATSLAEFIERRRVLSTINPTVTAAYWPVLPNSYWISPFADPGELEILRNELISYDGEHLTVLLDLELPILKPSQFKRNFVSFFTNRRRITRLLHIQKENISFATAEYWYAIGWAHFLTVLFGVTFPNKKSGHSRLIMYYSSTLRQNGVVKYSEAMDYMKIALTKEAAKDRGVQAALGTTDVGIFGNEIQMQPEELAYDLSLLKSAGFKEATIFRLAGIRPYLSVLSEFIDS